MDKRYAHYENLSVTSGLGMMVLDTSGQTLFASSLLADLSGVLQKLRAALDCEEASRIALLYGCYQARRFGGRYVFFDPAGLVYCAAPLLDDKGKLSSGILAGPFLMTDRDEFIHCDLSRHPTAAENLEEWSAELLNIPYRTPRQAHALSEHLYHVASADFSDMAESVPVQTDTPVAAYSLEQEDDLLEAIRKGDIRTADAVLNDMLRQILLHYSGNLEVLRSRVVELTVLLSRAALKGGADIQAILGLNYGYLREIDGFSSVEDIVLWLQMVLRQFTRHVFDFSGAKHADIIYKAVEYIKRNYAAEIVLQDVAAHLFISQSYFCRIFKEETGQTPGRYITAVRIEESKRLLRDSSIGIAEISGRAGFENQSYFTKVFRKTEGCTPGDYRRRHLERR
ncbi:MAG: helix-turn-helix domain-containing protein [Oscillospiraceae bacterium]|nr:helix-turn-helix domain-containing protein [Oscillospiraceae bacterium]